jgi:phosphohistidine phosphatase SixA
MIVFVLRHAEREEEPDDPALTEKGVERAKLLARMLGESGVQTAYRSKTIRARDTLQPLIDVLGADLAVEVPIDDAHGTAEQKIIAAITKALPAGTTAIVIGHTNTVGPIIEGLIGQTIGEIEDDQFDKLFVLSIRAPGAGTVAMLRYGAPTP